MFEAKAAELLHGLGFEKHMQARGAAGDGQLEGGGRVEGRGV